MRISLRILPVYPALLAALISGCLPSSCNRTEERALLPADSTSRAIAATVPIDTLRIAGVLGGSGESYRADNPDGTGNPDGRGDPDRRGNRDGRGNPDGRTPLTLKYPRTVAFAPDGVLWFSDTESHRIFAADESSSILQEIDAADFPFPYIAGFHGDTLLMFSPELNEIRAFLGPDQVDSFATPGGLPDRGAFQYATVVGDAVFFKAIADGYGGFVAQLDWAGQEEQRMTLPGSYWRYAGMLRAWGDSLLSLSGYRPIVHVITEARVDSMRLQGFDSPMLARSRRFVIGELAEPPLLTASAAAAEDYLFVLNMRPGWLRIDVYDHGGVLQHVLTQPSPAFNQNYFPTDIAARKRGDGSFELAVTLIEPEPRVERYLWWPLGNTGAPTQ